MTILFRVENSGDLVVGDTDTHKVGWASAESNVARDAALSLSSSVEQFAKRLAARGNDTVVNSRSIEQGMHSADAAAIWQALEKGQADRSTVDLDKWRSQIEAEGLAEQRAREADHDWKQPRHDMLAEARAKLEAEHARETPHQRVTRLCNERDELERLENERERSL